MGHPLAAVLLTLGAAALAATPWEVHIDAPLQYATHAARLRRLAGREFHATAALFGTDLPGELRVVLAPEGSELASRAPSWVSGYALPGMATIVLFPARVPSYPDRTLDALFEHELAHLLLDRAARGRPLPRWFHEGLATVAAREWGIEDRARFAVAVLGRRPRSLSELDEGFLGSAAAATRSYALSAALLRHFIDRFGSGFVAETLRAVAAGVSFEEAFRRATGTSPEVAAAVFFRRETLWNTWVPFLTSTTALWMAITLLTLFAIRARRRRDAEIRARWAAEEARGALGSRPSLPPEDDPSRLN